MSDAVIVTDIPSLPRRLPQAHKGDFGRVLVVGGSVGMIGAPALATNAALRSGAGLVTVAVPMVVQQTVAALCPSATSFPLPQSSTGTISSQSVEALRTLAAPMNVAAIGPGLGRHLELDAIIEWVLAQGAQPVVLDADGLNTLAARENWWPVLTPMVVTPHPGEMRRLLDSAGIEIELDHTDAVRQAAATQLASQANFVVVLKGHRTVVTDGRRVYFNTTGNPGMATGGSGDVLTGITAACIAQGLDPFDAAVLAVHVHGLAGDLAAAELGEISMTSSDLLDYLPRAWQQMPAAL